jgi:hypothetical protein
MAHFDRVAAWEVDGLANVLAECGMPEGHPWFDYIMPVGTRFCGVTHGVDSVNEMVEQGLGAKFLKAIKAEFPEFPKTKQKKLREVLAEMRTESTSSDESSVISVSSKRGRKSKFADDADIEWVTRANPHKYGSDRWCMWEVAFETKNRGDFLSKDGMRSPLDGREAIRKPHSGYFSQLVKAGHIIFKA